MSDFEDRVRRALGADVSGVVAEQLLGDVHQGVAQRKRRRAAAVVAASALAVVGIAGIAVEFRGDQGASPTPPPTSPVPTSPSLPAGAAQGVIDVSVISSDRWYRLTTNVGCVACSTVWQNEQSAEGGWERLHDFGEDAYVGEVDPTFGPIHSLVMAEDGENGWAWGRRLYSTRDGGRTWNLVRTGPGGDSEYGRTLGLTEATVSAWSMRQTEQGTELWRTVLGSDDWTRADAPNMAGVSGMLTLSDYVLLETSDEGLSGPRLQYFRSGDTLPWGEVMNPCQGENLVYPAPSVAFILCPSGEGATIHRLVGVEHPVAGEQAFRWYEFGQVSGVVTAVHAIDDRRLLIVGRGGTATLLTDNGATVDTPATPTPVDLGLARGEETFSSSVSSGGGATYLVTSAYRLIASTDGGRTWHEVE